MKTETLLARRMLLRSKTSLVLSVLIAAFSVASMTVVFSLCAGGFSAFLTRTAQWGESPFTAAYNGLITMISVSVQFFLFIFVPNVDASPVGGLFTEKANVETQPVLLLLTAACGATVAYFTVRILFAVRRKQRRHFYSTLLSAGASPSFARACARAEARYLCVRGIPAGLLLGYGAVLCIGAGGSVFFRAVSARPGGGLLPDKIGFFLSAGAAAALFGWLFLAVCAGNAVGELTVKNTAAETRERLGADIGVSVFTPDSHNLKLLGFPHYVALRSMENQLGKYAAVFLANTLYMAVCGISILDFFLVANYNGIRFGGELTDASRFLLSSTVRFIAAAAAMQLLLVFGTFFAMLSIFESNNGCYVLMRALGASERLLRRVVRREGVLCVLFGGVCSTVCIVFLFSLLYLLYGRAAGLTLQALLCALGGVLAMTAVFAVGVAASVRATCRRIGDLDLIRELKEFSYS